MKQKLPLSSWALMALTFPPVLVACSASDDNADIDINYIEDEECCSLDQEEQTLLYLDDLHELTLAETFTVDRFEVKLYTKGVELRAGYNDLYFTVEKPRTGRHVKDVTFTDVTPLMTMAAMNNMQHSTPVGSLKQVTGWIPVFHTWVSFLMPTDVEGGNTWDLSFHYRIQELEGDFTATDLPVAALSTDDAVVKSFKAGNQTYFLTLANPTELKTGVNEVTAYISQKPSDLKTPYPAAKEHFTIEVTPTMPDMGNHTSPNNVPLTYNTSRGAYVGQVNLTMTGRWNLHLVVKDSEGNIVAGDTTDDSGASALYWSIQI